MKGLVLELLINPDVRPLLTAGVPTPPPAPPAPSPRRPGWWVRLMAGVRAVNDALMERADTSGVCHRGHVRPAAGRLGLVATGVGLVAALAGLLVYSLCPPALSKVWGRVRPW